MSVKKWINRIERDLNVLIFMFRITNLVIEGLNDLDMEFNFIYLN